MTIFAPLIGSLWRTLEAYGIDPMRVIEEDVYHPDRAFGMSERVPYAIYNDIVGRVTDLVADPAIGLRSAEFLHPSHLGALGHAWLASSSLRTAIGRAQRFSRMYDERIDMQVSDEPGVLKVVYRQDRNISMRGLMADAQLASLLVMCRLNFGRQLVPAYVRMCRSTPANPSPWHELFGLEVVFDQAENCLAFKAHDANKQLTGSSPMLVTLHEDVIKRQIADLDRSDIIKRTIVTIMEQLPSGGVSEVSVADALNMTKRTLHRKLSEKEISFRTLLTGVRKDLVQRYINEPAYNMTEISFLLGYADTSAFSRAFKRWYGRSPTMARMLAEGSQSVN